jgi:hypothetical protein
VEKSIDEINAKIADVAHSIFANADWTVETPAEAVLVKLFALRGTPVKPAKCLRDIDQDYAAWHIR